MRLNPRLPPGRANRKALQFAADIRQLRHAGYPFSAIRQALLDAGLSVSLSTVKREAAHKDAYFHAAHAAHAACPAPAHHAPHSAARAQQPFRTAATAPPTATVLITGQPDPRSAKDEAEAFVRTQTTNPLVRTKVQP